MRRKTVISFIVSVSVLGGAAYHCFSKDEAVSPIEMKQYEFDEFYDTFGWGIQNIEISEDKKSFSFSVQTEHEDSLIVNTEYFVQKYDQEGIRIFASDAEQLKEAEWASFEPYSSKAIQVEAETRNLEPGHYVAIFNAKSSKQNFNWAMKYEISEELLIIDVYGKILAEK